MDNSSEFRSETDGAPGGAMDRAGAGGVTGVGDVAPRTGRDTDENVLRRFAYVERLCVQYFCAGDRDRFDREAGIVAERAE